MYIHIPSLPDMKKNIPSKRTSRPFWDWPGSAPGTTKTYVARPGQQWQLLGPVEAGVSCSFCKKNRWEDSTADFLDLFLGFWVKQQSQCYFFRQTKIGDG